MLAVFVNILVFVLFSPKQTFKPNVFRWSIKNSFWSVSLMHLDLIWLRFRYFLLKCLELLETFGKSWRTQRIWVRFSKKKQLLRFFFGLPPVVWTSCSDGLFVLICIQQQPSQELLFHVGSALQPSIQMTFSLFVLGCDPGQEGRGMMHGGGLLMWRAARAETAVIHISALPPPCWPAWDTSSPAGTASVKASEISWLKSSSGALPGFSEPIKTRQDIRKHQGASATKDKRWSFSNIGVLFCAAAPSVK